MILTPGRQYCPESFRSHFRTPWGFACELMSLGLTAEGEAEIVNNQAFLSGFAAGQDGDITSFPNVSNVHTEVLSDTLAWTMGFLAGRYASDNEYETPFCVLDHDQIDEWTCSNAESYRQEMAKHLN